MLSVKEELQKRTGNFLEKWDENIICVETDAQLTYKTNNTHGLLLGYTFTLVIEGSLRLLYNDKEFLLKPNDLYTYSPGLPVTILEVSDDYKGMCLIADENYTLRLPSLHNTIRSASFSFIEFRSPSISLSMEDSEHLQEIMHLALRYQQSHLPLHEESMKMIYDLFLTKIISIQESYRRESRFSSRVEEIFLDFQRLVSQNFIKHHDIKFYASQLNITSTYLSRIVKQVSAGHTVVDYINQLLSMEGARLLQTTDLSVAQIAEYLNFAETTTFARFFKRMRGMTPKEYRINKKF